MTQEQLDYAQDYHELPSGWEWVRLGSICDALNGRAFKSTEWRDEGLPIIRIQNLKDPEAPFNYFQGDLKDQHRVTSGDLLFAWSGTPGTSFGAHIWKGPDAALNQHIFNIRFDRSEIDPKYFLYALNQNVTRYVEQAQGGVGLAHITKSKFMASSIPLAPLAQQKRIVEEIEKQFSRLDEAVANLKRVKANLKRYRAAALRAATDADNRQWLSKPLGEVSDVVSGFAFKSKDFRSDGVPVIKIANIGYGRFEWKNQQYLPSDFVAEYPVFVVKPGDLLLALTRPITNETLKVCRYPADAPVALLNQRVAVLKPTARASSEFLSLLLQSDGFKGQVKGALSETLQPNLSPLALKRFSVDLPARDEQQHLVNKVERRLSSIGFYPVPTDCFKKAENA